MPQCMQQQATIDIGPLGIPHKQNKCQQASLLMLQIVILFEVISSLNNYGLLNDIK